MEQKVYIPSHLLESRGLLIDQKIKSNNQTASGLS